MASQQEKALCVLRFEVSRSVMTVQREFRARFRKDTPCRNNITRWYRQFVETGCLCKGKSPGRPRVSDDNIERVRERDNHLLSWPPHLPDLTPRNFFFLGFVKDSVYVLPLPTSLKEHRDRITHPLQAVTAEMLHQVWDELDYRVDVCRVTQGAHIEGL
jgi:hypothetical protein